MSVSLALATLLLVGCSDYRLTGKNNGELGEETGEPDEDPTLPTDTGEGSTDGGGTGDGGTTVDCGSILIYSTEAREDRDNYLGFFTLLPVLLTAEGYSVRLIEQALDGPLTAEALDGAGQLWIFGTDRDLGSTMSDDQADVAVTFAESGGGVLIAADHSDVTYSYSEDVNPVAERLGVQFSGSRNESSSVTERTPESPTGPLLTGVTTLPGFVTVGEITALDAGVQVAFLLDGEAAVVWRDDALRVVFDRSWLGWSDLHLEKYDQATYVRNVAELLDPCGE